MSTVASTHHQLVTAPRPPYGSVGEQRIVLEGISWDTYERLLTETENRGVRLTYDRGKLEIMSPSLLHERLKRLLAKIIEILAEELNIPYNGGGSTTFRNRDLSRGLEPDECFWLANAPAVTGKSLIDFGVDPPPDLAVEVELSSSSLDKMVVYAALRIREVWRYDGQTLRVTTLESEGTYRQAEASLSFPKVPIAQLQGFLEKWADVDEGQWAKHFREWVRMNHVKW